MIALTVAALVATMLSACGGSAVLAEREIAARQTAHIAEARFDTALEQFRQAVVASDMSLKRVSQANDALDRLLDAVVARDLTEAEADEYDKLLKDRNLAWSNSVEAYRRMEEAKARLNAAGEVSDAAGEVHLQVLAEMDPDNPIFKIRHPQHGVWEGVLVAEYAGKETEGARVKATGNAVLTYNNGELACVFKIDHAQGGTFSARAVLKNSGFGSFKATVVHNADGLAGSFYGIFRGQEHLLAQGWFDLRRVTGEGTRLGDWTGSFNAIKQPE